MKQSIITSKWWEIPEVKPFTNETFWRTAPTIDSNQLTHRTIFWRLSITWTGTQDLNIWFVPSLIHIFAFESWHAPFSNSYITNKWVNTWYHDSGGNMGESTTKVVYLSHAWLTTCKLKTFWKRTRIECDSYNHSAIVYWTAYP